MTNPFTDFKELVVCHISREMGKMTDGNNTIKKPKVKATIAGCDIAKREERLPRVGEPLNVGSSIPDAVR
jgi:hypothetical protein